MREVRERVSSYWHAYRGRIEIGSTEIPVATQMRLATAADAILGIGG
jgi:hypothetical protein